MNGVAFGPAGYPQKAVRMMKCQEARADRLFATTVIDGRRHAVSPQRATAGSCVFRVPARAHALMC